MKAGEQKTGKSRETIRGEEGKERRRRYKYVYKSSKKRTFPIKEAADENVSAK